MLSNVYLRFTLLCNTEIEMMQYSEGKTWDTSDMHLYNALYFHNPQCFHSCLVWFLLHLVQEDELLSFKNTRTMKLTFI